MQAAFILFFAKRFFISLISSNPMKISALAHFEASYWYFFACQSESRLIKVGESKNIIHQLIVEGQSSDYHEMGKDESIICENNILLDGRH